MEEFIYIKPLGDVVLSGRNIIYSESKEAFDDFRKRLKRANQRGEFETPKVTPNRPLDRCMVVRQNNVAFTITAAEFDEKTMMLKGRLTGPKADMFKINETTKSIELLNGNPVKLNMRALIRPKSSDKETVELTKILSFDLCST